MKKRVEEMEISNTPSLWSGVDGVCQVRSLAWLGKLPPKLVVEHCHAEGELSCRQRICCLAIEV